MITRFTAAVLPLASLLLAPAAHADTKPAAPAGISVLMGDGLLFSPILDARLRWEDVQQPTKSADAVTIRARAGFEVRDPAAHLALLAEMSGVVAIDQGYNALPFAAATSQYRPAYAVVADPENIALNRLQLQYRTKAIALTVGRQRINLDDERWVGSAGWRQNEQTFDAVRGEGKFGPLLVDGTYSDSQRTIYGGDADPRVRYRGRFVFLEAGVKFGTSTLKGFSYLLDYDPTAFNFQTNSSQTYGARFASTVPAGKVLSLSLTASYARQTSYASNPFHYGASYLAAETGLAYRGLTFKGGYEQLGSDPNATGGARALQTPMATLHKFNGWADLFLTTPAKGLRDAYLGAGYKFAQVKALPGLNAQVVYHQFNSDTGGLNYGHEWDASAGFKLGRVTWLIKYADYIARTFGTNTRKLWLQAEFSL